MTPQQPTSTGSLRVIAAVYRVQTTAERTIRLTLDLPESATVEAAALMEYRRQSQPVIITVEAAQHEDTGW